MLWNLTEWRKDMNCVYTNSSKSFPIFPVMYSVHWHIILTYSSSIHWLKERDTEPKFIVILCELEPATVWGHSQLRHEVAHAPKNVYSKT